MDMSVIIICLTEPLFTNFLSRLDYVASAYGLYLISLLTQMCIWRRAPFENSYEFGSGNVGQELATPKGTRRQTFE